MIKVCSCCRAEKPFAEFYVDRKASDGFTHRCKACDKEYQRGRKKQKAEANKRWYAANGEAYLAKKRAETKHRRLEKYSVLAEMDLGRWRKQRSLRMLAKTKATPVWVAEEHHSRIRDVYALTQQLQELTGAIYHVDHIVPLRNEAVCGLHVWWNLQPLLEKSNVVKGDLFDPTIFPEQGEVAFPSGNGQTRAVGTLTGERR